jgi:hypothetical protein
MQIQVSILQIDGFNDISFAMRGMAFIQYFSRRTVDFRRPLSASKTGTASPEERVRSHFIELRSVII